MTWVFCAGMIRSGSTVQYQLTSAIVEFTNCGMRVPYVPESDFVNIRDDYAVPFAVFKAHVCHPDLRRECLSNGAKVVYSYRDIRDVAVSAIRKFEMPFDELIDKGWLDQAIRDYYQWISMPDVLVSRYESFHTNLVKQARNTADFLQISLCDETAERIARNYQMDRQKGRIAHLNQPAIGPTGRRELVFDKRELLHWNHIFNGQVGSWKTSLSRDQQACLNDKFGDWLSATGYANDEAV